MVAMTLPAKPWTNGMMTADGTRMFDSTVGSEGAWRATPIPAGGLPAGSIIQWGSNTAPPNWLICDGSAVSRALWPSLFATIGTTYGSGDGSTTFNLPDLRGRVAVGRDGSQTEFDVLGETGGAKSHSHGTTALTAAVWAGFWKVRQASTWTATNSGGVTAPGSSSSMSNSGAAIEGYTDYNSNLSPYLVTNYIIKATTGWSAGDSQLATRVGNLEIADATTNRAGLVPIIPVSVDKGAGTVSVSSTGVVTLTNVTNFSLNGVFSALFRNYRFIIEGKTASAVLGSDLRLRSGITDAAGATDYAWLGPRALNWNGISINGTTGGASWGMWDQYSGGQVSMGIVDILRPFELVETKYNSIGYHYSNSIGTSYYMGHHKLISSYDGITFTSNAQVPFTGTVQILGYR